MTLREQQEIFARNVPRLIDRIFAEAGHTCTLGEVLRPEWVAAVYAKEGKGIINSVHCLKLAIDINLFVNGNLVTNVEGHRVFGEFWKSLHPLNRWGGDFTGKTSGDANHYSMEWGGRK